MQWYEEEVVNLISTWARQPPPRGIVFYGSSSIRLWSTLAEDFAHYKVINAGFGGSTMEACAHFFARIIVPLQPLALVIYAGDNDLGDGKSPHDVLNYYRSLINQVDQYLGPIAVALMSIKPSPSRWGIVERIMQANAVLQQEVQHRPRTYFIDIFPAMLEAGRPLMKLFEADGLHLSHDGYQVWRRVVSAHLSQLV